MKIRPVGAELFQAGGQTNGPNGRTDGHDKANSRCLQFCERVIRQVSGTSKQGFEDDI